MNLYIELRNRTRTAWILAEDCADNAFDLLDAWNRWQFGASMGEAGNWAFDLIEDLSELCDDVRENAAPAETRRVEIHEIGSILAMA